jgi:hypothetical protein
MISIMATARRKHVVISKMATARRKHVVMLKMAAILAETCGVIKYGG